jgi:hypothetical protein
MGCKMCCEIGSEHANLRSALLYLLLSHRSFRRKLLIIKGNVSHRDRRHDKFHKSNPAKSGKTAGERSPES